MSIGQAVVAILRADATVRSLVANNTSPQTYRIFHQERPQESALPAIVFTVVSTTDELALDGPSGLKRTAVIVDVVSADTATGAALVSAIRTALGGVTGIFSGVSLQWTWCTDETDISEVEGDFKVRRVSLDFEMLHG